MSEKKENTQRKEVKENQVGFKKKADGTWIPIDKDGNAMELP